MPDPLVEVANLTYRLVFVLLESTRTIAEAQAARLGYTGYRTSLRSSGSLVAAVFVRSWMRARRLEEGLAGRGYVDSLRTLDPPLRSSGRFLACALALVAAIADVDTARAIQVGIEYDPQPPFAWGGEEPQVRARAHELLEASMARD